MILLSQVDGFAATTTQTFCGKRDGTAGNAMLVDSQNREVVTLAVQGDGAGLLEETDRLIGKNSGRRGESGTQDGERYCVTAELDAREEVSKIIKAWHQPKAKKGDPRKMELAKASELRNWYLKDEATLAFNDLDGSAKTTFLFQLRDGSALLASFGWGVRPGAKPAFEKAVWLQNGETQPIEARLQYDLARVSGTFVSGKRNLTVDLTEVARIEDPQALRDLPLKIVHPK
ncbi:MAG: hypothetical protein KF767_09395 [Bdellovibrionaceae bacterium]|nr:hypothetical protein [Pseudobdellovibrionaceae bacterium]